MIEHEISPDWEEFKTGQVTLNIGMSIFFPDSDTDPGVRLTPTIEDENGGIFATAHIDYTPIGLPADDDHNIRQLYFGPDERRIRVNQPLDIEKYEIDAPGKGSHRKFYIIGAMVATAATGLIVRKLKKK